MKWVIAFLFFFCSQAFANALMIDFGDSVSLGYTKEAIVALHGTTISLRHDQRDDGSMRNDGCMSTMIANMQDALSGHQFNTIILNAGIHDIQQEISKFGCGQTSISDYAAYADMAISIASQHAKHVVVSDTPPIQVGALAGVDANTQELYNEVLHQKARKYGAWIWSPDWEGQRISNVHFTFHGYILLGRQLADCLVGITHGLEQGGCHH